MDRARAISLAIDLIRERIKAGDYKGWHADDVAEEIDKMAGRLQKIDEREGRATYPGAAG
jgi:hypothetical protein